jgi:prolipoprotein diacylglyceryl transferase
LTNFLFIIWDVSPEIFSIGFLTIRWYGLLFAAGILIGQTLMYQFFKLEKKPESELESLLLYMVLAIVLGARLGHCLFYEPAYYLSHPIDILKIWEGGLASHGATVGILLAVWLFAYKRYQIALSLYKLFSLPVLNLIPMIFGVDMKKEPVKSEETYTWLYLLDRLVMTIALGGAFIRTGNLMNSEIVGLPTNLPWGVVFRRNLTPEGFPEDFARHPSQVYEAIFCVLLFLFLLTYYLKLKEKTPNGLIFGWFVVLLFTQRIIVEFTKENQVAFENGLPLNMGQILSIPMVLFGIFVLYRSYTKPLEI